MKRFMRISGGVALSASLLLAGCGSSNSSTASSAAKTSITQAAGITPAECDQNRQAGTISFLTSYGYSAAASILDVVAADQEGYFKQMCLDVKLQPGFSDDNISQVSSGKVSMTSLGSSSEVAVAVSKQAQLEAIAVYGHSAAEELAAADGKVASLKDLPGTTMGVLGTIPYSLQVMIARAGVSLTSFKQMQAPYDPTLLAKGDFQSRPVYKSNEPYQLDAAGVKYHVFDPSTGNIPASFGTMVVNKKFAQDHPLAVEDFLRADLAGYRYAAANPTTAVGFALQRNDPKSYIDPKGEQFRWSIESALVQQSTSAGKPVGYIDQKEWDNEMRTLVDDVKVLPKMPDDSTIYDDRFIKAAYNGTTPIWK